MCVWGVALLCATCHLGLAGVEDGCVLKVLWVVFWDHVSIFQLCVVTRTPDLRPHLHEVPADIGCCERFSLPEVRADGSTEAYNEGYRCPLWSFFHLLMSGTEAGFHIITWQSLEWQKAASSTRSINKHLWWRWCTHPLIFSRPITRSMGRGHLGQDASS